MNRPTRALLPAAALLAAACVRPSARASRPLCDFLAPCAFGREVRVFEGLDLRELHADGAGRLRALLSQRAGIVGPGRLVTVGEDGAVAAEDAPVAYGVLPRGAREPARVIGPADTNAAPWQLFTRAAGGPRWTGEDLPAVGLPVQALESTDGRALTVLGLGAPPDPARYDIRALLLSTRDAAGAWSTRELTASGRGDCALAQDPAGRVAVAFWEDRPDTSPAVPAAMKQLAAAGAGPRERVLVYLSPDGARREAYVDRGPPRSYRDRVSLLAPAREGGDALIAFTVEGAVRVATVRAGGGVDVALAFAPVAVGVDLCGGRPRARDRAACESQPPCRLETRDVHDELGLARTADGAAWLVLLSQATGADLRFRWVERDRHPWDPRGPGDRPPPPPNHCEPEGERPARAELDVVRVGPALQRVLRREVESESSMSPAAHMLRVASHGRWIYWGYTGALGARIAGVDTSRL